VHVHDPQGMPNAARAQPQLSFEETLDDAVRGADLVCVLTEWAEFRTADPAHLGRLAAAKRVIDGRNCLDVAAWKAAGWQYRGMGSRADRVVATWPVDGPTGRLPTPRPATRAVAAG